MSRYFRLFALIMALACCFAVGCSDRGTNSSGIARTTGGILNMNDHSFYPEFVFQIKNPNYQVSVKAYTPEVSLPNFQGTTSQPVPMLILLSPEGADQNYYFNHGLKQIADEMIASGEIQPMTIACFPNDRVFGGYFYAGDHGGAGNYDTLVGGSLLEFLYSSMPYAIDDPAKRGIGGFGQGAYGAFRAALMHKGEFRSVSVVDGPLDFDGSTGNGGLIPLFTEVLNEQGLLNDPDAFVKYDSLTKLSNYFIGGGLAFSPDDTLLYWQQQINIHIDGFDTIYTFTADIDSMESISYYDTTIIGIDTTITLENSATLVEGIINLDGNNLDFHLPFDNTGAAFPLIWDMWMNNNLATILSDSGAGQLSGVSLWVASSPEAKWNYHDMTMSWVNTLKANALPVEVKEYTGYSGGSEATGDQYMYDLLRDMLKFHSDNFSQ